MVSAPQPRPYLVMMQSGPGVAATPVGVTSAAMNRGANGLFLSSPTRPGGAAERHAVAPPRPPTRRAEAGIVTGRNVHGRIHTPQADRADADQAAVCTTPCPRCGC